MDAFVADIEMYMAYEEAQLNLDACKVNLLQGLNRKKLILVGKSLLSTITVFSILGTANSSFALNIRVQTFTGKRLRVHQNPENIHSPHQSVLKKDVITLLNDATPVTVLRKSEEWDALLIQLEDGTRGWVSAQRICNGGFELKKCLESVSKVIIDSYFNEHISDKDLQRLHSYKLNTGRALALFDQKGMEIDYVLSDKTPFKIVKRYNDRSLIAALVDSNEHEQKWVIAFVSEASNRLRKASARLSRRVRASQLQLFLI